MDQSEAGSMTFRRYLVASAIAVVLAVVIVQFSRTLRQVGDWPFVDELLLAAGGLFLLYPLLLLLRLGRNTATVLSDGRRVSHIRVGPKILIALFLGAGILIITFVTFCAPRAVEASVTVDQILRAAFFMVAIGIAYLIMFFFVAKVIWNDETIEATTYLLGMKRHKWSDLKSVVEDPLFSDFESHLIFRNSGKARISFFYSAHKEILQLAESKLNNA